MANLKMPIATWTARNNLRLRVYGEKTGFDGEARYAVTKETATNPAYSFSVRAEEVVFTGEIA